MLRFSGQSTIVAWLIIAWTGCSGFHFGPGFSKKNSAYFSEQPRIVVGDGQYCLRWKYGSLGFYFFPESKVVNGQLLFSLQATSSSGDRAGRYGELQITDAEKVRALQTQGAFWLEPDGTKIRLEVRRS